LNYSPPSIQCPDSAAQPDNFIHRPQGFLCQLSACLMIIICAPLVQTPIRSSDSTGLPFWNPNFHYPKHENLAGLCRSACQRTAWGGTALSCVGGATSDARIRHAPSHCRCVPHSNYYSCCKPKRHDFEALRAYWGHEANERRGPLLLVHIPGAR